MKYLIALIFLGIVIQSMTVAGQRSNSDNEYEKSSPTVSSADDNIPLRRPTNNAFNGRFKKVLKLKKERSQESLPVAKRLNRTPNSQDSSASASSNKQSFTVNNYDDNDDYFSRRRARFIFRQRVGK